MNEFAYDAASVGIWRNPANVQQVRDLAAGAWVAQGAATFADCKATPSELAPDWYYSLPAGITHAILDVYPATATAFTDERYVREIVGTAALRSDDARLPATMIASAAQMGTPAGETAVIEVVNGRVVASNGFEAADRVKLEAVHTVKPDNKPTVNAGGASLVSNPTAGVSIDFEDGKVEIS
jgi:hypothetical protein